VATLQTVLCAIMTYKVIHNALVNKVATCTGVFRKAAQSLVRLWALVLGGRLYGAKISIEYYLYLFPYTVRPTLYRV